ncbi:MAG TPA: hypothetical protein VI111_11605, partial [Thermoleophilaceae bacterium]
MFVRVRKPIERERARRMRRAGTPYKRIARELGVSASSVVAWTRDITLSADQHHQNLRGPRGPLNQEACLRRAAAWSARCRARRAQFQLEGQLRAREGNPLHLQGCMLYWAEGGKGRNSLIFANSDVHMHRLFRRFLREALGVPPERMRIRVNVHTGNGLTVAEIERYWLDALQLPVSCLRKASVDQLPRSSGGRAKGKLPYGVATLTINSTRVVQHIFGAIQEYGN